MTQSQPAGMPETPDRRKTSSQETPRKAIGRSDAVNLAVNVVNRSGCPSEPIVSRLGVHALAGAVLRMDTGITELERELAEAKAEAERWNGEVSEIESVVCVLPEFDADEDAKPVDRICNAIKRLKERAEKAESALAAEQARCRELEADARRYCWAVENAVIETESWRHDGKDPSSTKHVIDAAIDAATAREGGEDGRVS